MGVPTVSDEFLKIKCQRKEKKYSCIVCVSVDQLLFAQKFESATRFELTTDLGSQKGGPRKEINLKMGDGWESNFLPGTVTKSLQKVVHII